MEGDACLVSDVDNPSQTQELAAVRYHLCHYLTDALFILCYKWDLYTNWEEKLINKRNNSLKKINFYSFQWYLFFMCAVRSSIFYLFTSSKTFSTLNCVKRLLSNFTPCNIYVLSYDANLLSCITNIHKSDQFMPTYEHM